MTEFNPLKRLNDFEDAAGLCCHLVPYKPDPMLGLEGRDDADKDLIRRARLPGLIRTTDRYEELLAIMSSWGCSVETPLDWDFPR